MYLESMTIDEIMELIENKGYMSFETMAIMEEIECSKRIYDRLIATQGTGTAGGFVLENAVVRYYLFQLDQLKSRLPYDAMGGQFVVPILLMQELEEMFEDYKEWYSEPADATLQEGMKKVVAWSEEREGLMNGSKNIEQKKTR